MNTLYTLGYTGLKQARLLEIVQTLGALVVDTRFSPRSRAVQWTGAGLRRLLGESYLHLRSLGNINYKGDGPIQISNPAEGVPQVASLLAQQPVILLCVCGDVHTCHRKVVAELVQLACDCEVIHLIGGEISPLTTSSSSVGGEISPFSSSTPAGSEQISPRQPGSLFGAADFSVTPTPQPTDAGGQLTLTSKPLPLHQRRMF